MIGRLIGNYKVISKLGEGGMGEVYRGIDVERGRDVAIKVLPSGLEQEPKLLERFRSEAVTLARLNHPNIATIYSFLRNGDIYYLVMEFVTGETIKALLTRQGLVRYDHAIHLVCQALEGLEHAHRMSIIHRDLKPANIMVTSTGGVKILDFGIARVLGNPRLTTIGMIVGTPAYMSPEQIRGLDVDFRSDIYSMGIVFYQLLTGQLPFPANNQYQLYRGHVEDQPPPLRTFAAHIPKLIDDALMQALAKDPNLRFKTAEAFRYALLQGLSISNQQDLVSTIISEFSSTLRNVDARSVPSDDKVPASPQKLVIPLGNDSVNALPQSSAGEHTASSYPTTQHWSTELRTIVRPEVFTNPPTNAAETVFRPSLVYKLGEKLTFGHHDDFALSPNCKIIAASRESTSYLGFVARKKDLLTKMCEAHVTVYDLSTKEYKALLKIKYGAGSVAFSPDGTNVAIIGGAKYQKYRYEKEAEDRNRLGTLWTMKWLTKRFFAREMSIDQALDHAIWQITKNKRFKHKLQHIYIYNLDSGKVKKIPQVDESHKYISYSPDGRFIAAGVRGFSQRSIAIYDVNERRLLGIYPIGDYTSALAFSPDGENLVCGEGAILTMLNLRSGKRFGFGRFPPKEKVLSIVFSPDGRTIASGSGIGSRIDMKASEKAGTVCLWDYQTGKSNVIGRCDSPVYAVAFSPDGQRLVSGGHQNGIYLWDINSGNSRFISIRDRREQTRICFLPDGNSIISRDRDGRLHLSFLEAPPSNPLGNTIFRLKGYTTAKQVILSGSFNGWNEEDYKFIRGNGEWIYQADLWPGFYFYQFIVDGQWINDPENPSTSKDESNVMRSVLEVSKHTLEPYRGPKG